MNYETYKQHRFSDKDIYYSVFICNGKPGSPNYSERGAYTELGNDWLTAAERFAAQWNKCCISEKYGERWNSTRANYEGLPEASYYVTDDKGNRLLLIRQ